jgi:peptide/nickel transport system permease protein
MLRIVATRLAWAIVSIWAVVTLAFFLNHGLPADPARAIAGPQARPADVARIRTQLGLDQSVWVQYRLFAARLVHRAPSESSAKGHASCEPLGPLHVDLGTSYQRRKPVIRVIADRFPRTFYLAMAALVVELAIGVAAGVLGAVRRRSRWDRGVSFLALLGISAPTFLVGILLQYVFAYRLRWLPLDGYGLSGSEHVASIVLPALTLGISGAAYYARLVRGDMIEIMQQDFVRTARAKGAGPARVVVGHALRNALLPLVTVVGLDFGVLLGGAVVTEKLFRWPGIGQLSVDAVFDRDAPVVLGVVILTSTMIVLANLAVDLSYALLDPRTKANSSASSRALA